MKIPIHRGAGGIRIAAGRSGTPVMDVCRSLGISEATFYIWKKKYGDLGASEVRRLRQLEGRECH